MSALKDSITAIGVGAAADACGVSIRAVYKWMASGSLPRTDFTGETNYAERLAAASLGGFTAEWLRSVSSPKKAA